MALVNLNELKELTLAEGITARVVHASNMSIAHVRFVPGAVAPMHSHHHEQVDHVIEGERELTVDGDTRRLGRGQAMVLAPLVPHSAKAVSACYLIDVFHPVREDMRAMAQGLPGKGR
ncbi:MAG: cupin domain-containing protein [candidate division Zixibacteria bacterium]|nr:cupin domain-containing protein [candidate division Zixibacteria bacterium]